MRCDEHGLAAGPSGECVVCLRETRAREARRVLRLCALFVVSVLGACGALLVFRALRSGQTLPRAESTAILAPPPQLAATASAGAPSTAGFAAAAGDANAGEPAALASATTSVVTDAGAPLAATSAEAVSRTRTPTSAEVQAAYHATPVLMFSTTWCPHCNRARQFFQANGLNVVDRDIDADPSANAELKRRIGKSSIPLIEVDGQQLQPGFSEQATMQAIAASVQRRTGVVTSIRYAPASAAN